MKNNYENFQATEQYRTLSADLSNMPFSFVYDGRKYQGFSPEHFTLISKDTIRSDEKETQTFRFLFLHTLEVTLILTHYFSHGITEWTVWLEICTRYWNVYPRKPLIYKGFLDFYN